jgi:hypothetical protein
MTTQLRSKFEAARDRAAELAKQAERSDAEETEMNEMLDRAEQIDADLKKASKVDERLDALAEVSRSVAIPGTAVTSEGKPANLTAGEFLAAFYQAHHPEGSSTPEEFLSRAAQYIDATTKATYVDRATQATSDTAGIIPAPIIGEVVKLSDSRRPVFNSLTPRGMPAKGKTFERPRVTQRTTAGTQTEGQSLSTQKMTLTSDTVTKATQGGTLDLTVQDIDWTEPEALQIVVADFIDTYAEWTEGLACDFLESQITVGDAADDGSTYSPYTSTNVGTLVTSYINGFVAVYNKAKRFPDTVWHDLASAATLASTTNTNNDRTALSMIREALDEMGVGNVRWVTGPQLAANTRIIGASSLIEGYEVQKGLLRAEKPSTLTVELAYAGYTAFWGRHEGFVQLGTDPS